MACGGVDHEEIRIILIGRTGDGKSSTGNTIIGRDEFKVSDLSKSQTKTCDFQECTRSGRRVVVVDTPGFYDTELKEHQILRELLRVVAYSTPGFHAIVFVLARGRFTEELEKTLNLFQKWFGKEVKKHALLILTNTDSNEAVQEYFDDPAPYLAELKSWCGNTVLPFQNKGGSDMKERQVDALLDAIEQIKKNNNGTHFKHITYTIADWYAKTKSKLSSPVSYDSMCMFHEAGISKDKLKKQYKLNLESFSEHNAVGVEEGREMTQSYGNVGGRTAGSGVGSVTAESGASRKGNLRIFDQDGVAIQIQPSAPAAQRGQSHGLEQGSEDIYSLIETTQDESNDIDLDTMGFFEFSEETESSPRVPIPKHQPRELNDFVSPETTIGRHRPYGSVVEEKYVFDLSSRHTGVTSLTADTQSHHDTPASRQTDGGRSWQTDRGRNRQTDGGRSRQTHVGRSRQTDYEQPSTSGCRHDWHGSSSGDGGIPGERSRLLAGGSSRSGPGGSSRPRPPLPGGSRSTGHEDQPESFRENMRDDDEFGTFAKFFIRILNFFKRLKSRIFGSGNSGQGGDESADRMV